MMDDASAALAETKYCDAERIANEALHAAFEIEDFERMARICMPLLEARRQKRLLAIDSGNFVRLSDVESIPTEPKPGCYLFEPMLVAADARNYRELADQEGVPVFVLALEPVTQLGDWPVAMIGPVTLRTKVDPPQTDDPDVTWMQAASEQLGDDVLLSVDQDDAPASRIQDLLEIVSTLRDHERVHQALASACKDAMGASASQ